MVVNTGYPPGCEVECICRSRRPSLEYQCPRYHGHLSVRPPAIRYVGSSAVEEETLKQAS